MALEVGVCSSRGYVCQELGATLGHIGFSSPLASYHLWPTSSMSSVQGNQARVKIKSNCAQLANLSSVFMYFI